MGAGEAGEAVWAASTPPAGRDEVVDLFFHELGAAYAWIFHYMPIGRSFTLDLMITPQQRVQLFRRVWELVKDQRLFLADFWASATATNGCLAGGRSGGYFYVDWNGALSPCVFMPYSPLNINEAYAKGQTLDDMWEHPFFGSIRDWQRDYGYRENGEKYEGGGNWIRPCLIPRPASCRDLIDTHQPTPTNSEGGEALLDPAYKEGLERFDDELATLTDPIWEGEYKKPAAKQETKVRVPVLREAPGEGG